MLRVRSRFAASQSTLPRSHATGLRWLHGLRGEVLSRVASMASGSIWAQARGSPPNAPGMRRPSRGSGAGVSSTGRLHVHVTLGFLLTAFLPGISGGPRRMALWMGIVFVSLLVHELGHAVVGIAFGSRANVTLLPLGGSTILDPPLTSRRAIAADLAGPLASLCLGLGLAAFRTRVGAPAWLAISTGVNLWWGALNLLPMLPFDGGRVSLELVGARRAPNALLASACAASALAATGLAFRSAAGFLVFSAVAILSGLESFRHRSLETEARLGLADQLEAARILIANTQYVEGLEIAQNVAQLAKSTSTERAALELIAWSYVGLSRPHEARASLSQARPAQAVDLYCRAVVEDACGCRARAIELLESERVGRGLGAEAIKFLVELHTRDGKFDRACAAASGEAAKLATEDVRRIIDTALGADAWRPAADLSRALFARTSSPDDAIACAYALARSGDDAQASSLLTAATRSAEHCDLHDVSRVRLSELSVRLGVADFGIADHRAPSSSW